MPRECNAGDPADPQGKRVVAHTTAAGPFVGTPMHSFGAHGDVDANSAPPLPIGPFIAPPRRALTPLTSSQAGANRANDPSAHAANVIGDVSILQNLRLRAPGQPVGSSLAASDGSEQSVATNGKGLVLYTFNFGAALSTDGGYTFSYLNPGFGAAKNAVFPSADGGLCCDQVVTYLPQGDRFVWVMQYWVGTGGVPDANTSQPTHPNRIRVATATSAQLLASGGTSWSYRDFTPSTFGLRAASKSAAIKLDHPFVAFTRDELYLSVTAADWSAPAGKRYTPAVWRIPIAQLSTGTASPDYYVAPPGDGSSLLRPGSEHRSRLSYAVLRGPRDDQPADRLGVAGPKARTDSAARGGLRGPRADDRHD